MTKTKRRRREQKRTEHKEAEYNTVLLESLTAYSYCTYYLLLQNITTVTTTITNSTTCTTYH